MATRKSSKSTKPAFDREGFLSPNRSTCGNAERFALPLELLQQVNQLPATDVFTGNILLIPACTLTPTGTLRPATQTITPTRQTTTTPQN